MYVCLCNGITDSQIHEAVCNGACCIDCLKNCLGVATGCGKCAGTAQQILLDLNREPDHGGAEAA